MRRRVTVTIDLRWLASIVLVLALAAWGAYAARRPATELLATALTVEDPLPDRAEAVFVHAGGLIHRTPGATAIARRVGAETIVVSREVGAGDRFAQRYGWHPPGEVEAARHVLDVEGWPGGFDVVGPTRTTMDDAALLRRWCEERGVRSVVAVTSPPHTRRARFCHRIVFAGSGIDVRVRPSMPLAEYPSVWPDGRDYLQFVVNEAARLVAYRLRY